MKYVISGTDRQGSKSLQVSLYVQNLYAQLGEQVGLIDLGQLPKAELDGVKYGDKLGGRWGEAIDKVDHSSGLIIVCPEYNGSMPGILKLFIDYWKYPDSFEHRPMCFVGLGGMFGGLRPVEHLQQVMGFRNAYILPQRLFLQQIHRNFDSGVFKDPVIVQLLEVQAKAFQKFVLGLESQGLDANHILAQKRANIASVGGKP